MVTEHKPFLSRSGLTGKWWLVTQYTEDNLGNTVARTKWDMDTAISRIQADALREARDNYRPGDNNPWALNVRKFLDYRANLIEGGE